MGSSVYIQIYKGSRLRVSSSACAVTVCALNWATLVPNPSSSILSSIVIIAGSKPKFINSQMTLSSALKKPLI